MIKLHGMGNDFRRKTMISKYTFVLRENVPQLRHTELLLYKGLDHLTVPHSELCYVLEKIIDEPTVSFSSTMRLIVPTSGRSV